MKKKKKGFRHHSRSMKSRNKKRKKKGETIERIDIDVTAGYVVSPGKRPSNVVTLKEGLRRQLPMKPQDEKIKRNKKKKTWHTVGAWSHQNAGSMKVGQATTRHKF